MKRKSGSCGGFGEAKLLFSTKPVTATTTNTTNIDLELRFIVNLDSQIVSRVALLPPSVRQSVQKKKTEVSSWYCSRGLTVHSQALRYLVWRTSITATDVLIERHEHCAIKIVLSSGN